MCGIAAIFAHHSVAPEVSRDELRAVRDHMAARGPDGVGEWFSADGRVGMGHRRLSIVDLSTAGNQPMSNEDGRLRLVFNGEIYNFRELRERLVGKGHVFRSHSDSEVLLHLYEEKGEAMVHELRGMFAFALWDESLGALLLARDPYGIKPLYYADDGWTVRAASQVKALLAGGRVSRAAEPAGVVGFFLLGSVPEPFTTYQEIRAVPAGSVVWVDSRGASAPKAYFRVAQTFFDAGKSKRALTSAQEQESVRAALLDSVRHHLVADVPVGAFLSAGIDSGAVVGLARDAGAEDLQTVTLAFEEFNGQHNDEAPLAEEVARLYGTRHTTRVLSAAEFRAESPKIFAAMDQPSVDGINTYFVSRAAAELGLKVALSGLGGDELLGGYTSFIDVPHWVKSTMIPGRIPGCGRAFRSLTAPLIPRGVSPKLAGLIEYGSTYQGAYLLRRGLFMPWELKAVIGREMAEEGLRRLAPLRRIKNTLRPDPKVPFARVATLEASWYMRNQLLRDTDWAGMAHSLEVRVPLVDAHLLKAVAPVLVSRPAPRGKSLLAQSPATPLPLAVARREKTGFTVPVGRWLEQDKNLDVWRRLPGLAKPGCHWARRWAYTLAAMEMAR
jgi:asparagine synthase (glutamine-hydrolysing)